MNNALDPAYPNAVCSRRSRPVFALLVLAGFARTYYLKFAFGTPPLPGLLVHLHGG